MRRIPRLSAALACVLAIIPAVAHTGITLSGAAKLGYIPPGFPEADQTFQDWHAIRLDPESDFANSEACLVHRPDYLIVAINDGRATTAASQHPPEFAPDILVTAWEFGIHISFAEGYRMRNLPFRLLLDGKDVSQLIMPDASAPLSHRSDQILAGLSQLKAAKNLVIVERIEITPPLVRRFSTLTSDAPNGGASLSFIEIPNDVEPSVSEFKHSISLVGFSDALQQALEWCRWTDDGSNGAAN